MLRPLRRAWDAPGSCRPWRRFEWRITDYSWALAGRCAGASRRPRRCRRGSGALDEAQQEGEIEGFDAVFLEPHGGDLGGFFLIKGERDKLARIRWSDEVTVLNTRAQLIVENFGVVGAELGGRIEAQMGIFLEAVEDLA
jgi:hypothetical protein